ncbi:MAG TPA: hypothetical protein VMF69_13790 [Gemmataceae bacterium]|nr:hypothetical protein [Gemmataceae bacterium]
MNIQASVIQELRSMFKEGATPSRLIQHIVARHPHEGNWHGLIQDYFREAFAIQIVRGLSPAETYSDIDLRYAYLNEDVLHEMVQMRSSWDQGLNDREGAWPSWLDTLVATNAIDRLQEGKQLAPPADFSEAWEQLSENDRAGILRVNSSYTGKTELVQILARLVERLQQRIIALERNRSQSVIDKFSAS